MSNFLKDNCPEIMCKISLVLESNSLESATELYGKLRLFFTAFKYSALCNVN